jgi:hypothetical protein
LRYVCFNFVLVSCFLCNYILVSSNHLRSRTAGLTTEAGMQSYWAEGFPPASPLPLAKWLLLAHTGQIAAYPMGAANGGSSLTVLVSLVGAWHFWRSGRRAQLVLCAAPFPLWLLAATLHRYPYGTSCRLAQHVAPAFCLTAGMGAAVLLARIGAADVRRRWIIGVCSFFLLVGVGGIVRDAIKPYRDAETLWTYRVMRDVASAARSGTAIAVFNRPDELDALFRWYLELYGSRVSWDGKIDWARAEASGQILCLHYSFSMAGSPEQCPRAPLRMPTLVPGAMAELLQRCQQPWALTLAVTDTGVPPSWRDPIKHLDQIRWIRARPNS